jgi:pyridoxal phosphate enzyme (YggS family)
MSAEVERLQERLDRVRARVAAVGRPDVRIIGVTKGHPPSTVAAAAAVGLTDVGESYAQELAPKAEAIAAGGLTCHFIGQLQTNKVRAVAGIVDVYQSVDRPSLVTELARRAPGARVLVQVDLAGIEGEGGVPRGGCGFGDVADLAELARDGGLVVEGLMGVAPPPSPGDPTLARRAFDRLAALRGELGLAELSIGMSDDLEDALAAGSTMVRVGTALFGPRER